MKKLLCGVLSVSAMSLFAVDVTVATVDVTAIDSGLSNTVVAVSGLDLATGGALAISNLVKTTDLTVGDKLYAFSNGKYECWTLSAANKWERAEKQYTISGSGEIVEDSGTPASLFTLTVGSGIWLSRQDATKPFYIYGQHTDTKTSTVAAGATALVGNPTMQTAKAPVSIEGCKNGDRILVPGAGMLREFKYVGSNDLYESNKWEYKAGWSGTVTNSLPPTATVPAGTGFWYKSTGEQPVTINWE